MTRRPHGHRRPHRNRAAVQLHMPRHVSSPVWTRFCPQHVCACWAEGGPSACSPLRLFLPCRNRAAVQPHMLRACVHPCASACARFSATSSHLSMCKHAGQGPPLCPLPDPPAPPLDSRNGCASRCSHITQLSSSSSASSSASVSRTVSASSSTSASSSASVRCTAGTTAVLRPAAVRQRDQQRCDSAISKGAIAGLAAVDQQRQRDQKQRE
jgi:hypothetical protein